MTIIDSNTVVVYTSAELKTILEGNNTYTLIYFGANIKLTTGILVFPSKTEIVIDGTYQGVRYNFEDVESVAYVHTIYINSASSVNITLQNMDITGHNYYGIIATIDSSVVSGVVVTYNNIKYIGPQISYNAFGKTRLIDCDIRIQASTSPANEVAETSRLEIGGTTKIVHTTTTLSMFWFRATSTYSLNILPNSNVNLETASYMNFMDGNRPLTITFGAGSITNIDITGSMSYLDQMIDSFIVENDAEVNIEQKTSYGDRPTLPLRRDFILNNNSSLRMVNNFVGNPGNSSIRFFEVTGNISINNPKSVVIYNLATNAIRTTYTIPYSVNLSQYNRWNVQEPLASAGDIYNIPEYSWYKLETLGNILISGTLTSTGTTISSHNFTPDELTKMPALVYFIFNNTKVLSMGRPSLTINPISDITTQISGTTVPFADTRITYNDTDHYVQADANGDYVYNYATPLPIGTQISFVANLAHSFLYRFRTEEIIFDGDIQITNATNLVTFSTSPFKINPTLFKRSVPLEVTVSDSRITPKSWRLYATINQQPTNDENDVLTDGLVFIDDLQNMSVLTNTPLLVYTSDGLSTGDTVIDWTDEEGILLQLNIVPIKIGKVYKATISWSLES